MRLEDAEVHAERWIRAWNNHALDDVLALYAEDVVLHSSRVWDPNNADGTVQGKHALRAYFATALERYPQLELSLMGIYVAHGDRMVLEYLNRPDPATEIYVLERTRLVNRLAVDVEAAYGVERPKSRQS